jgi:hypothetical protein
MNTEVISERARQARPAAVLVWLLSGVFYVPGWAAGKLWFCVAWAGCAIAEGFIAGAGRSQRPPPADRM